MAKCLKEGCKNKPGKHTYCQHHRPDSDFEECSICQEPIKRTKDTLDCNHSFHRRCIDRWSQKGNTCPICRTAFMPERIEEPWYNVLHDTIARAINDIQNGARNISINLTVD